MAVINTNITSLIAQQNLSSSKGDLTTAMERLSSGLRINSAKDDAAGQAIANRMSSQITGLSQAQRNSNDGISVAQTTEGALNQVNDNLQRVRELAVQAENGTNSQSDLNSIQNEIGQRLNEINRISEETSFNGVKVLASDQSLSIQVGANDGETIDISLKQVDSGTLNLASFNVNGYDTALSGVSNTNSNTETFTAADDSTQSVVLDADSMAGPGTVSAANTIKDADGTTLTGLTIQKDDSGSLFATDGTDTYAVTSTTATYGDGTAASTLDVVVDTSASLSAATSGPTASLDSALKQVDTLRSDLGAVQNRFDSAITNLATTETNLTAARSRIEDADYATEVANLTRGQILQQAGTSVLAQANQLPQSVLSLLG